MNLNILESETAFSQDTIDRESISDLYNSICPISGEVATAMEKNIKDPENLKITATPCKCGECVDESSHLYIEAFEFVSFLEANGYSINEGKDAILDHYRSSEDGLDNPHLHVVFPSKCVQRNTLGIENLGRNISKDWPMQLIRGCKRYGISVNSSIEGKSGSDSKSAKGDFEVSMKNMSKKDVDGFVQKFKETITQDKLNKYDELEVR